MSNIFDKYFSPSPITSTSNKNTTSTPPLVNQNSNPGILSKLAGAAPAIGGTIGMIGGGLLGGLGGAAETGAEGAAIGTAVEPGGGTVVGGVGGAVAGGISGAKVGSTIGGGIGQGLGEWVKEFLQKQPTNPQEIAKQSAIGGIFGAMPEVKSGGVIAKTLARFGIGAGVGATTQGIQEVGNGQDTGLQKIKDVASSAVAGGVANSLFGGVLDAGGNALKFLGEKIPGDIYDAVKTKSAEVQNNLFKTVQGMLVGHDNIDYALQKDILPKTGALTTKAINDSLQKSKDTSQLVEGKLQNLFENAGNKITVGIDQKMPNLGLSLNDILENLKGNPNPELKSNTASAVYNAAIKQLSGNSLSDVSVAEVNQMKRAVGAFYSVPGVSSVYKDLQQFVEEASGNAPQVHALNQEAGNLMDIKANLSKWKNLPNALPHNVSPEGIKQAVNKAKMNQPASLKALIGMISLGAMGVTSAITKSALSGMAVMFGMNHVINQVVQAGLDNPETRLRAANALQDMYHSVTDANDKLMITKAIETLGIRQRENSTVKQP